MRAYTTMRLDDGTLRELGPCDVIGRMWTAALQIPDPLVSEAHALVSLREGSLKLLGLRGRLAVQGRLVQEVALSRGLKIDLSPHTSLEVVEVELPDRLLALAHPELGRRVLSRVVSVTTHPRLDIVAGAVPDAAAVVWSDGLTWSARLRNGAIQVLDEASILTIEGHELEVVAVTTGSSGEITAVDPFQLDNPLLIEVRYDTVHIHRDGLPPLVIDGKLARLLSELAVAGVPMSWNTLARDLWPDEDAPTVLRRNWDAVMARLRRKLRDASVRTDLVRPDHSGNVELVLRRVDRVEDRT